MENDEKLKEKQVSSTLIYKGKIIDVYKDEVICPNGHKSTRELIRHCKASCILAITNEGKVIIERQYRYPYNEVIYEFPAGKCDKEEDPKVTALRELEEETGYKTNNIKYLGKIYPTCAYSDEVIYCYYADSLEVRKTHLDENEFVEVFEASYDEIKKMIRDGDIKDAKTIACFAFLEANK